MEWHTAQLLKERNYGRLMVETEVKEKPKRNYDYMGKRCVKYNGENLYLPSDEVIERFKELYPTTKNKDLKEITGHGVTYNSRLGNYLGLKKDADFMLAMQREHQKMTTTIELNKRKSMRMKNEQPKQLKGRGFAVFHPTPEQMAEMRRKSGETLRKTIEAERRRVMFGLPQKTKRKIGRIPRNKVHFRYRLKNVLRYIEIERNVFTFDANTRRSERMEKKASIYNIKIVLPQQD